jgi:hypothetical protein
MSTPTPHAWAAHQQTRLADWLDGARHDLGLDGAGTDGTEEGSAVVHDVATAATVLATTTRPAPPLPPAGPVGRRARH